MYSRICTYILHVYVNIFVKNENEGMDLKEYKTGYMGGFSGKKRRGEIMQF